MSAPDHARGSRALRPSELPRQRGRQTDRVLARPAGRPPGPGAPRPARRALPTALAAVAETVVGFVLVVLTVAAAMVALGLVGAWWIGL